MRLANDPRLMGELKNTRAYNVLGWGTFVLVAAAVATMLLVQALGLFGIHLFGG